MEVVGLRYDPALLWMMALLGTLTLWMVQHRVYARRFCCHDHDREPRTYCFRPPFLCRFFATSATDGTVGRYWFYQTGSGRTTMFGWRAGWLNIGQNS